MKRMLEMRWEMAKWITSYINENEEKWGREKQDREKSNNKWMENWAKKTRFEKIREIKERELENSYKKNINPTIKESKFSHNHPNLDEQEKDKPLEVGSRLDITPPEVPVLPPSHTYAHQASQQPDDAKQDDLAQQVDQEHPHLPQVQSSQQDDNKPAEKSQPVKDEPPGQTGC